MLSVYVDELEWFGSDACNCNEVFACSAIMVTQKAFLNFVSPVSIHDWRRNI